jgi:ketosteroid isomerase-like protein
MERTAFLAEEKASHYSASTFDEFKVRVFGDTAVASYALTQKYTNRGKAHNVYSRETDTWVKMSSGSWQCVAAHASSLKKR